MSPSARGRAAFVRACELDVLVRKPGNVSLASPGHGMDAAMFVASAHAAAEALFAPGQRVGRRIEAAVAKTWAVAGCNTNLGIVLLCAPIAAAIERAPGATTWDGLHRVVEAVLADLDLADAQAAYRAIAQASPGGLGNAPVQDVHDAPSIDLRAAMALAADRDSIARQYRDGFSELFETGREVVGSGFSPGVTAGLTTLPDAVTTAQVQAVFLSWLAAVPDSHIVRKRGNAAAQTVMRAASVWQSAVRRGVALDSDPDYAAWDEALKIDGINPGTTADLTVATLMLAGLLEPTNTR